MLVSLVRSLRSGQRGSSICLMVLAFVAASCSGSSKHAAKASGKVSARITRRQLADGERSWRSGRWLWKRELEVGLRFSRILRRIGSER